MSLDGSLDVAVGDDSVEFVLTVQNGGTEPIDLEFPSGKVVDVAVEEDGSEVWRWSDGRMFVEAVQTETVPAGGSVSHAVAWDEPRPGEYTATASLEATDRALAERASFTVD